MYGKAESEPKVTRFPQQCAAALRYTPSKHPSSRSSESPDLFALMAMTIRHPSFEVQEKGI
jgi:hypothetical protein